MPGSEVLRVFVAIELPPEVKAELGQSAKRLRMRYGGNQVKWVDTDSIHLTLKFLGETAAERLDAVRSAIAASAAGAGPLPLALGSMGAFPGLSRPRVIWVGLEGATSGLIALARRLDQLLQAVGFEPEARPFSPHLTLARLRPEKSSQAQAEIGSAVSRAQPPEHLHFTASQVSLVRSQLRPEGPLYTSLARWPLGRVAES